MIPRPTGKAAASACRRNNERVTYEPHIGSFNPDNDGWPGDFDDVIDSVARHERGEPAPTVPDPGRD